jgi:hypothetical protein
VASQGFEADSALIVVAERSMRESGASPDSFFHRHRGGRNAEGDLAERLAGYRATGDDHPLWSEAEPPSLVIEEVERIWAAIDGEDTWNPLHDKIAAIRRLGEALGPPPAPAGQP